MMWCKQALEAKELAEQQRKQPQPKVRRGWFS